MKLEILILSGEETATAYDLNVDSYEIIDNFSGLEDISSIGEQIHHLLGIKIVDDEGPSMIIFAKKILDSCNEYITKDGTQIFVNLKENQTIVNIEDTMIWLDLKTAEKHFMRADDDDEDDY